MRQAGERGGASLSMLAAHYSTAHFGKTLIWAFFNTFFLFFAVFGLELSPIVAGSLVLLFAAVDALSDIPASFLIARYAERLDGMRLWVFVAAPICAISLVACFALFNSANTGVLMTVSIAAGVAFRIAFTFIDVPLNASIGRFTFASRRRNVVAGGRSLAGTAANLVLAVLTALAIENGGEIQSERLWQAAAVVAIAASAIIIPSFWYIDKRASRQNKLPIPSSLVVNLRKARIGLTSNIGVLTLANCTFLLLVTQFASALIFIVDSDAGIQIAYSKIWLVLTVGSAVTVWFWVWLASRINKADVAIACLMLVGFIVAMLPIARTDTFRFILMIAAFAAVYHVNTLIWSMLPDAVDEVSVQVRAQMHAPIIGVFSAIGKLMIGLSQFVGGAFLSLAGYPDDPKPDFYQSLIISTTIIGCALACLLLLRFRLSHSHHEELVPMLQSSEEQPATSS